LYQFAYRIIDFDAFFIKAGVQMFNQLAFEQKGSQIILGIKPDPKIDV